ncbi:MAG: ATP-dependent DNA helicase RecG [Andreesenia angusta]|nr:ATP-dependent DNA helicase RecG [Andreesenia angusta]
MEILDKSIRNLKGIGEKKESLLNNLGIKTIKDLIYYFPVNYENRKKFVNIVDIREDELVSIRARVKSKPSIYRPRRNMSIIKIAVEDGTDTAYLTFFNQNYRFNQFNIGDEIYISGKAKVRGLLKEFNSPIVSKKLGGNTGIGKINPIYSLTKGISNSELKKFIKEGLKYREEIKDIPIEIKREYDLLDIDKAIEIVHFPEDRENYIKARNTIAFNELLELQLSLLILKNRRITNSANIVFPNRSYLEEFKSGLEFKLTNAQIRVIEEIEKDMESDRQMNRLVQGDVGSGKTIIAVYSLLKTIKSGYQGVMMAPTEILARQHYNSLKRELEKYDIEIGLLISNLKASEKKRTIENIKSGDIDIVIGTHAVIEDDIEFYRLGLVITDEQHRFGVNQRAKLSNKGRNPDILVMTATPIPRTLALIVYGDLDISIIDEMPPGRKEIKTYGRRYNSRRDIYDFVQKQIKNGRQAYVVCPLVEDSDIMNLKSVESVYKELKENYKSLRIEMLHGRMNGVEKDDIMIRFKDREIDILVSTTVIEVGVDVPNANIMVIENSERFGLAQLHQLRGRVGRGKYQSYCILLTENRSQISTERIKIMQKTNDGFIVSEKDLELRGPGEFFGLRQHGVPELKLAKLPRDLNILSKVQILTMDIMKEDPYLNSKKYNRLKEIVNKKILL